jgi:hypothetical protein
MIDKFLERAVRFNERIIDAVRQLGLLSLAVEAYSSREAVADRCLALLQQASLT